MNYYSALLLKTLFCFWQTVTRLCSEYNFPSFFLHYTIAVIMHIFPTVGLIVLIVLFYSRTHLLVARPVCRVCECVSAQVSLWQALLTLHFVFPLKISYAQPLVVVGLFFFNHSKVLISLKSAIIIVIMSLPLRTSLFFRGCRVIWLYLPSARHTDFDVKFQI